jgi:hypothetical protein
MPPDKGQGKAAYPHPEYIPPPPFNTVGHCVDPDGHHWKGQKHEPQGNEKRSFKSLHEKRTYGVRDLFHPEAGNHTGRPMPENDSFHACPEIRIS